MNPMTSIKTLKNPLDKEQILEYFKKIYLIRACEDAIKKEYHHDQMKTPVHLVNGSEAIATGVLSSLPQNSKVFGTYRSHALYLELSQDPKSFFLELYGRKGPIANGKAGSMHLSCPDDGLMLTSAVVGTTIPSAVGAALAHRYKNMNNYSVVFFGDGATEEGVFWESLNFACLKKLKVIFVCEDNDLAINTLGKDRKGYDSLSKIVAGYNCYQEETDGYAIENVIQSTNNLINKMEKDVRPGFLYCKYFRFLEHVGINEDFDAGYRLKPNQKELEDFDPLNNILVSASQAGIDDAELASVREEIDAAITEAIEQAKVAPKPNKDDLLTNVYAGEQ